MDALWIAPVVALAAALGALIVAGRATRQAAAALVAEVPASAALGAEVTALHTEVAAVRDRLERCRAATSGPILDR